MDPDEERALRKVRSEEVVRSFNLPLNPGLPAIDAACECQLRNVGEVVDRVLALCYIVAKGQGAPADILEYIDEKYGAISKFTPLEAEYVGSPATSLQEDINAGWRYEQLGHCFGLSVL